MKVAVARHAQRTVRRAALARCRFPKTKRCGIAKAGCRHTVDRSPAPRGSNGGCCLGDAKPRSCILDRRRSRLRGLTFELSWPQRPFSFCGHHSPFVPAVVAGLARTLGHAGATFPYPKCSFLVSRRLNTSLGYFGEVWGLSHLCGGRPLQLSRIASFLGICSALKQPAAPLVAHGVLLPPSSHLPPTVQAWPNHSLKRSANGRPPGPVWWYAVHFHQPGPGVLPSSPA